MAQRGLAGNMSVNNGDGVREARNKGGAWLGAWTCGSAVACMPVRRMDASCAQLPLTSMADC